MRDASLLSSAATGFWRSADARRDLPEEGGPRRRTCLEGIEREEETESKIEDHKSCGGAAGVDGRESSIVQVDQRK